MWKLDREDHYYKIYDERKTLVGYFGPEYGDIQPAEKAEQVMEEMHKRHDKVKEGYLVLPLVKFGIFEDGQELGIDNLLKKLSDVKNNLMLWRDFLVEKQISRHKIMVSHTDHDMLSITLGIVFSSPVPLDKEELQKEISGILDPIHQKGLL